MQEEKGEQEEKAGNGGFVKRVKWRGGSNLYWERARPDSTLLRYALSVIPESMRGNRSKWGEKGASQANSNRVAFFRSARATIVSRSAAGRHPERQGLDAKNKFATMQNDTKGCPSPRGPR